MSFKHQLDQFWRLVAFRLIGRDGGPANIDILSSKQQEIAMSELNLKISSILDRHRQEPAVLIQELFNLMSTQASENKKVIQTAILFAMESIHQWENICYYIEKWHLDSFRHDFIQRMKRRTDQDLTAPHINSKEELRRLIEKYWLTRSPKKEENKYKEPINLRQIVKKIDSSSQFPHEVNNDKLNRQTVSVPSQDFSQKGQEAEKVGRSTMGQVNSLTGRPAILKKASIFDQKSKQHDKQEESTKSFATENVKASEPMDIIPAKSQVQTLSRLSEKKDVPAEPEKKERNVLKLLADFCGPKDKAGTNQQSKKQLVDPLQQVKQRRSSLQKERAEDQPFPSVEQFAFGSTKKSKDAQLKRLTISPNKRLQASNKIIKIKRAEPSVSNRTQFENGFQQFSFCNNPAQEVHSIVHHQSSPFFVTRQSSSTVPMDLLGPKDSEEIKQQQDQRKIQAVIKQEITPCFLDGRFSQGRAQFLSRQELKVVQDVEPKYTLRRFLSMKGITLSNMMKQQLRAF